ncbi:TIGR03089 family protein [Tsukamurella asaccharolytica]|uniref:TIGR03089 family protein n=1 Tax=Tsukamurella asaccharolytica TaxID=2592067 RepID=A0A5C5R8K8_9ACTN|nr:TIGR03089 family protein [Tsukamurella asaccharolytica]TWS19300.1 TIGR03089 family protein [Tsukamurella asaccharolytica]
MRGLTVTDRLLVPIVQADGAAPRFTWYDDATHARMGLSAITLGNWAAKCGNLLRDQYGLGPGDPVGVLLPAHWQTAGILFGAWWAGCEVRFGEPGDVTFCAPDRIDEAGDSDEILAVGLDAFGLAVPDLPPGIDDYTTEVRVHPDAFTPGGAAADVPVLAGDPAEIVLARSTALAASAGYAAGDRVLSTREWRTVDDLYDGLLAPLAAPASVIHVAHPDPATLADKFATEKATARVA